VAGFQPGGSGRGRPSADNAGRAAIVLAAARPRTTRPAAGPRPPRNRRCSRRRPPRRHQRRGGRRLRRRAAGRAGTARPSRPVRHRDAEPATGLAAEALAGNLVITADRVIAWYRLPLLSWTFRPEGDRLAYVRGRRLRGSRGLAGRRCHLRVTSRPFEAASWAAAFDTAVRGPAGPGDRRPQDAMPGPCEQHPWRSHPGCPSCVPGAAWIDFLLHQQRRMRQSHPASRDVYLGVEVTARGAAHRLIGQAWSRAASAERASVAQQAEIVRAAVEGAGLGGRPATPGELRWLLTRSCSIGLPAPLPVSQGPAARPVRHPRGHARRDHQGGAGCLGRGLCLGSRAVRADGAGDPARRRGDPPYATVLTIADMTGQQELAGDSPWIQRTDHLPFGVDWLVTFDVLDAKQVARVMGRQADRIRAQYAHITEHGQDPPQAMQRQMDAVKRIEEEADNSAMPGGAYVYAWPRIAVTGQTPDEVRGRVAAVTELYAPGMTVRQPP